MKKILFILILCFLYVFGFAQYPLTQNIGSDSTLVHSKGSFKSRLVNQTYTDTTAANIERISSYAGATIFTTSDEQLWLRNSTATAWVNPQNVPLNTQQIGGTYIISGLNVVWDSLLVFDVTAGTYMINGVLYHSSFTVVTLDTLIGSDPRRDEIIADTLGIVSKITGTPSSDPAAPTPNPLSQIGVTDVLINAGDNVPANVTQNIIYNEGTGTAGGEWDTASTISNHSFRNTSHPYIGIYDFYVPSFPNAQTVTFTNSTTVDLSTYSSVSFAIRLNSTWANNVYLFVRWFNGTTVVSSNVAVRTNNYGWVRTTTGVYQRIVIPMSAFNFSSFTANRLTLTTVYTNSAGFYLDYVQLQTGLSQPQTTTGIVGVQNGNLSPLFNGSSSTTNNIVTLSYAQQNATAYRVFGNFTNTSAAPTFGQIDLSTSVVTGHLPVTNLAAGSENQILQIQSGVPTWVDQSPPGYDTVFTRNWLTVNSGATNDTLNFGSSNPDSSLLSFDTYVGLNSHVFNIQQSKHNIFQLDPTNEYFAFGDLDGAFDNDKIEVDNVGQLIRLTSTSLISLSITGSSPYDFTATASKLQNGMFYGVAAPTTTYSVHSYDHFIICPSGTFNVTLPDVTLVGGQEYFIKNLGSGTITATTTSSQTIDGSTTYPLTQYKYIGVISNGGSWCIISNN